MNWATATSEIEQFLKLFVATSTFDLQYEVTVGAESDAVRLRVDFTGADTSELLARRAELLHAMESLATGILRLEPEQHDQISFDAENYKAGRMEMIRRVAETAIASVLKTLRPFSFVPMTSRERRMLHMELAPSGLRTASSGEASRRFVVLYPPEKAGEDRARSLRNAFRPR